MVIVIKIKSYGDKIDTNFEGKKVPKENASHKCLSLIMLDSDHDETNELKNENCILITIKS